MVRGEVVAHPFPYPAMKRCLGSCEGKTAVLVDGGLQRAGRGGLRHHIHRRIEQQGQPFLDPIEAAEGAQPCYSGIQGDRDIDIGMRPCLTARGRSKQGKPYDAELAQLSFVPPDQIKSPVGVHAAWIARLDAVRRNPICGNRRVD